MFGRMILSSRARTALIRLEIPELPSECPKLGLTHHVLGRFSEELVEIYRADRDTLLSEYVSDGSHFN